MKKIVALDLGDAWIGTALSDPMHIVARPYETVGAKQLTAFITQLLEKERIETIVVGYPKTMRGGESAQTKKIVSTFETLQKSFPTVTWILWDERLTSKQAAAIKPGTSSDSKKQSHSIAAALILTSYLDHLRFQQEFGQEL
jgi:putative Holliday junction resolvase